MNLSRSFWFFVALGSVVAACDPPHVAVDGAETKEHVRDYLQSLVIDENWSEWSDYFAADASLNGSDFALQIMKGTVDGLHFSLGELTLDVGEQVAEGELVATRFTFHGIHERPFNAQPATNLPVELGGFVIDRFEGGLIVESRMLIDIWGLSQRTGGAGQTTDPE